MNKITPFAIAMLAIGASGCVTTEYEDETAAAFPDESGQEAVGRPEQRVHPGPYGTTLESIFPPFKLHGFVSHSSAPTASNFHMSDFYNPTGNEVFPEDHPFAGQPKPQAVVFMMSAVWCAPCNQEASLVLPVEVPGRQPNVQFVQVLIDGPEGGVAATVGDANIWATNYQDLKLGPKGEVVSYPLAIDPTRKIMPLFEAAFPGNMIIDATDMRIRFVVAGIMDDTFWNELDSIAGGG